MRKGKLVTLATIAIWLHVIAHAQQQTLLGLQTYFEEAYWRYPNIPHGLLEAAAYSASRMTNMQPAAETENCNGMPLRYGLFGLIENGQGYFNNNLLLVCRISNITPEDFKSDVRLQILSVAKFLSREASIRQMDIRVRTEDFAEVLEKLSEIPDDSSAINRYALSLFTYDIYNCLQSGFTTPSLKKQPVTIQIEQVFPALLLRKLKAPAVAINYSRDTIIVPGDTTESDAGNSSMAITAGNNELFGTDATGYTPAVYVHSNAGNYQQSRNGTKITNIAIHTTQSSYAGTISWFKNPNAIVSAHYVIRSSDGQLTQMMREADMAWHVRNANASTISIAHEGYTDQGNKWYTDKMYNASAALVRNICNRRSIDKAACFRGVATATTNYLPATVRIKGHQHYSGNTNTDPGKYWNWAKYADLVADKKTTPDAHQGMQLMWNGKDNELKINYNLNSESQRATLLLSDTYGRIYLRNRVMLQQGSNRFTMTTSSLKAGVYFVIIHTDVSNIRTARKFTK